MTFQEVQKILTGEGALTLHNNNGDSLRIVTLFHADVKPYEFNALMLPEDTEAYGNDIICVRFAYDASKGFLDNDCWNLVIEEDSHTFNQLLFLFEGWNKATDEGKAVYSKVITQKEYDMLFDPSSNKELTVYICYPDGTFGTVDFNHILFTALDNKIYFIALNDNNDVLPFAVYRDGDNDSVFYIQQVSVDVGNTIAEKLARTHIIGGDENFDILCNEDKHYHMRLRKDDELVEYKRLYIFEYDNEHYVYFRDIKTDLRWCFEIENVLGQYRAVRIDDRRKSEEIFWNHPFHYRVTNVNNLLFGGESTFTRFFGDEKETLYVVGNVVYGKYHYFALTTKEEKSKKSGDTNVMIYCLVRPRGEPWLYPVENEELVAEIVDRMNDK